MSVARWSLCSKVSWLARSSHCVSASNSGTIFVYGGELKPRTPVDAADHPKDGVVQGSVHLFNVNLGRAHIAASAQAWNTVRPVVSTAEGETSGVPDARVGATTVYDGEYLYVWGGRGGVDMAPLDGAQVGFWRGEVTGNSDGISWTRLFASNADQEPAPRSFHTSIAHAVSYLSP